MHTGFVDRLKKLAVEIMAAWVGSLGMKGEMVRTVPLLTYLFAMERTLMIRANY